MSNRKDRVKLRLWHLAEASAEPPLGIVALLAALGIIVAGGCSVGGERSRSRERAAALLSPKLGQDSQRG